MAEPLSEHEIEQLLDNETFAYLATRSLWAFLRCLCQIHVSSVDELAYEEFIRSF